MSTDTGVEVFLRPREVLEEIVTPVTVGQLCTFCDLPIVQGRFHWLDENDQPQRYDQAFGGAVMSFPAWRHANGTAGHGQDRTLVFPKPRCPDCGAFDTLSERDTGYGTDTTCSACSSSHYYDRGD
ncbi:hypothetical protein [Mycobacteroides abscessus]|uniref:hypothetical protein n=1 Tax=Mycobacteroides abscessus TaxID=36809 RepID=UPI000C25A95F|nr:hypothetical protein [Mycobacteroides abscessus]